MRKDRKERKRGPKHEKGFERSLSLIWISRWMLALGVGFVISIKLVPHVSVTEWGVVLVVAAIFCYGLYHCVLWVKKGFS